MQVFIDGVRQEPRDIRVRLRNSRDIEIRNFLGNPIKPDQVHHVRIRFGVNDAIKDAPWYEVTAGSVTIPTSGLTQNNGVVFQFPDHIQIKEKKGPTWHLRQMGPNYIYACTYLNHALWITEVFQDVDMFSIGFGDDNALPAKYSYLATMPLQKAFKTARAHLRDYFIEMGDLARTEAKREKLEATKVPSRFDLIE